MSTIRFNQQLTEGPTPLQERALREAYLALYTFVGAKKEDHFIFTSSGAEAVNHAVLATYLDVTRKTGKNHFLCGALDEAPAIMAMSRLQELGSVFQMVPACDSGYITQKKLIEMITPRTAMLSLSWGNGLTGVIQPLAALVEVCQERGVLLHIDATHVLGKGEFTLEGSGADLMTFGGPCGGMGGIFIRSGMEISPLILGGREQGNMRGGPLCVSALLECAQWAKEEQAHTDHYGIEIARLRSLFEERICAQTSARVLFSEQVRLPHITSFLFPGISTDLHLYTLTQKGVWATSGGNHLQHLVHILKGCGIGEPECHTGLSFGFSAQTTEEEIEKGAEIIVHTVGQLQKYSKHLINGVT